MGTTFFVLALLQCALLFFLSRVGSRLDREERKPAPQRTHWPRTGLIVPAGGNHPRMREALESLLKQDYPALYPVVVTAPADEPAAGTARALQARAGSVALVNGDDGHGQRIERRDAADDGCVVGEAAVAVQLKKAGKQTLNKVRARGALVAARDLDALIG